MLSGQLQPLSYVHFCFFSLTEARYHFACQLFQSHVPRNFVHPPITMIWRNGEITGIHWSGDGHCSR